MLTVTIRNLQKKIPILRQGIKKAVLKTLSSEGPRKSGEITICFVNDNAIKELNLMYLGRDCPTDVIAFDLSADKKRFVADLAVSTDTAVRNARIFKTTPLYEANLYVVHGILHLLGYDDKTEKNKRIMQCKADRIICQFIKPKL